MTVPAQDEVSLRAVVADPAVEFRASVEHDGSIVTANVQRHKVQFYVMFMAKNM